MRPHELCECSYFSASRHPFSDHLICFSKLTPLITSQICHCRANGQRSSRRDQLYRLEASGSCYLLLASCVYKFRELALAFLNEGSSVFSIERYLASRSSSSSSSLLCKYHR
mmetsp:Transcript_23933/g.33477  ORF Transcript_23933/g.33477 Transcript_23933/m.33477 type:complete len:112 (-) Transcript_23933:939-1274(-)